MATPAPVNPHDSCATADALEPERGTVASVFLCHSSTDKPRVRKLDRRLRGDGFQTWFDEHSLVPGEDWDATVRRAVRQADLVLACLSRDSVEKAGYVQRELRHVLEVADEQPEGAIFVIPVRLEDCAVPDSLKRWHWVDLYRPGGYSRLLDALREATIRRKRSARA